MPPKTNTKKKTRKKKQEPPKPNPTAELHMKLLTRKITYQNQPATVLAIGGSHDTPTTALIHHNNLDKHIPVNELTIHDELREDERT